MIGRVLRIKSVEDATTILEMKNKLIVVEFSASWCEPCRDMVDHFIECSLKHPGVIFLRIDSTKFKDYSASLGVTMVPTYCFYKHTHEVVQFCGASPLRLETELRRLQLDADKEKPVAAQELQQIVDAAWRRDYLPSGERQNARRESTISRAVHVLPAGSMEFKIESMRSLHQGFFSPRRLHRMQSFRSNRSVESERIRRLPSMPFSEGTPSSEGIPGVPMMPSSESTPSKDASASRPRRVLSRLLSDGSAILKAKGVTIASKEEQDEDISGRQSDFESLTKGMPRRMVSYRLGDDHFDSDDAA
eukprot:GEMP01047297.1.p1 GENE.GEMP01047297.1~~GEMP01047297.1.p1  ORF type:complete len:304 (+),score=59.36 GEMP01047297.1:103-1014(+)